LARVLRQKLKETLKEKRVMRSKKKHYSFLMKCFTAAEATVKASLWLDVSGRSACRNHIESRKDLCRIRIASDDFDTARVKSTESDVVADKRFESRRRSFRTINHDVTGGRRVISERDEVIVESASDIVVRQRSEGIKRRNRCPRRN
jgi:hypothetical protein